MHKGDRERMRERFYKTGLEGFHDHEVLEYILYFAIPRRDTNALAHTLLSHFGSLEKVLLADVAELEKVAGIGEQSAALLSLFAPVAKRLFSAPAKQKPLNTSALAASYIQPILYGRHTECLYLICMDHNYTILHEQIAVEGSIDSLPVYPREIAAIALRHNATRIILAHNHPSGNATPSRQDITFTKEIIDALLPLNIILADHLITTRDAYYSFAEKRAFQIDLVSTTPLFAKEGLSLTALEK
ncbi:MAG: RadC family protein [Christensenellaceae bacterium]|jgi:DNA repair protein RadC